jgi:GT2 family glycosyltransferase
MPTSMRSRGRPEVTAVIPTCNRRPIALRCVQALLDQELPPNMLEIILVDDGSTDGTSQAVGALPVPPHSSLVCIRQPNMGANAARNRGLLAANGRIILFLNDDSIVEPGMVAEHIRMHDRHPEPHAAVLGALRDCPTQPPSIFNDLHRNAGFDALPPDQELDWHRFYTYNVSVKSAFLGGDRFDARLRWHEDIELGQRLARRGLTIFYAPAALAHHHHPMSETGYLAMADREGSALAAWFVAKPDLKDELVALGLRSARLRTRALRHILADSLIWPRSWPAWLAAARGLIQVNPRLAVVLYHKLYQWRVRRAVDRGLPGDLSPFQPAGAEWIEHGSKNRPIRQSLLRNV